MQSPDADDAPTSAQITAVQTNLANMQALNDYIFNHTDPLITNAYLLLTEQADYQGEDLGVQVGVLVFQSALWAGGGALGKVGAEGGAVGGFLANILCGILGLWAEPDAPTLPPSLNQTFGSLYLRLSATSRALDDELAKYYNDVAGYWDTVFTYNGNQVSLSELASVTIPDEQDIDFQLLVTAALFGQDQGIWAAVLKAKFIITSFAGGDWDIDVVGDESTPPLQTIADFYNDKPSYYLTYAWGPGSVGMHTRDMWLLTPYSIGPLKWSAINPSVLNADACNYLFNESNPNGLFTRQMVFTSLGIPVAQVSGGH